MIKYPLLVFLCIVVAKILVQLSFVWTCDSIDSGIQRKRIEEQERLREEFKEEYDALMKKESEMRQSNGFLDPQ